MTQAPVITPEATPPAPAASHDVTVVDKKAPVAHEDRKSVV